jgi:hypothetical protein
MWHSTWSDVKFFLALVGVDKAIVEEVQRLVVLVADSLITPPPPRIRFGVRSVGLRAPRKTNTRHDVDQ